MIDPNGSPASEHPASPTTREAARRFAEAWADAWNRRDVEAVLAHFSEDTCFRSPRAAAIAGTSCLRGKAALRSYWMAALGRIEKLHFTVDEVLFDPERRCVQIEYRARLNDQLVHAAERLIFALDGQVSDGSAYYGAPVAEGAEAEQAQEQKQAPRSEVVSVPSAEQLGSLPLTLEAEVVPQFLDDMGHMNVAWYMHLFDRATWALLLGLGFSRDYIEQHHAGAFAAEQHVKYLAELRLGDRLEIRSRLLSASARRIHFVHFMSHTPSGRLAARLEGIGVHVDLSARRATRFPPEFSEKLAAMQATHAALPWSTATTIRPS